MIGVLIAALAVVYAFVQNHRQVREGQAIKQWVLANAPETWESLGPLHKRWLSPEVGLTVLLRTRRSKSRRSNNSSDVCGSTAVRSSKR